MATLDELKQMQDQLRSMNTGVAEELAVLVRSEIKRRTGAGRPSSGISRKEQNRLNSQRFRDKRKGVA